MPFGMPAGEGAGNSICMHTHISYFHYSLIPHVEVKCVIMVKGPEYESAATWVQDGWLVEDTSLATSMYEIPVIPLAVQQAATVASSPPAGAAEHFTNPSPKRYLVTWYPCRQPGLTSHVVVSVPPFCRNHGHAHEPQLFCLQQLEPPHYPGRRTIRSPRDLQRQDLQWH